MSGQAPVVAGALSAGLVGATAAGVLSAVSAARGGAVRRRLGAPAGSAHDVAPRLQAPAWFVRRLRATGATWRPGGAWAAWLGAIGAAGVGGLAWGGPGLAVVATVAVAVGPLLALGVLRDRADRLAEAALPDVLEAIGRGLRSGASLSQAIAEAAGAAPPAVAPDLTVLGIEAAHGAGLAAALDSWAQRRPLPGIRLAVAALGLGAETGGAQARAVDGVAATIRGRLAVEAEVRALSSQARSSALVIGVAPIAFALLAVGGDDGTAEFLFRTPLGLACLVAGLALDGLAAWWMARLTRVEP